MKPELIETILVTSRHLDGIGLLTERDRERIQKIVAGSSVKSIPQNDRIIASGVCILSRESGRVLMLQRSYDGFERSSGMWEFPGGMIEAGETPLVSAMREWQEETGCFIPQGRVVGQWDSGIYRGFVYEIQSENDIPIHSDRDWATNPDDPDRDKIESLAWWSLDQLKDNPAIRGELSKDIDVVLRTIGGQLKGGTGSGNFGHEGRPGEVGGSVEGDQTTRKDEIVHKIELLTTEKDGWVKSPFVEKFDPNALSIIEYHSSVPVRTSEIPISKIIPGSFGEEDLRKSTLLTLAKGDYSRDPIRVVEKDRKYYLEDGNHRLAVAYWFGDKTIKADVFKWDPSIVPERWKDENKSIDVTLELKKWRKFAINELKGNHIKSRPFETDIDDALKVLVTAGLEQCEVADDVRSLFDSLKGGAGSGNFDHEGRPGEVGGSADDGVDNTPAIDSVVNAPSNPATPDVPKKSRFIITSSKREKEVYSLSHPRLRQLAEDQGLRKFKVDETDEEFFKDYPTESSDNNRIGYYKSKEKRLHIRGSRFSADPMSEDGKILSVAHHELGHAVDKYSSQSGFRYSGQATWRKIGGWGGGYMSGWTLPASGFERPPTEYAGKNPIEDFAESTMLYFSNHQSTRDSFRLNYPKRYKFLYRIYGDIS